MSLPDLANVLQEGQIWLARPKAGTKNPQSEILGPLKWQGCLSTSWTPIKCLFLIKWVVPVPFTWYIQTVRINIDGLNLHHFRNFLCTYYFFFSVYIEQWAPCLLPDPQFSYCAAGRLWDEWDSFIWSVVIGSPENNTEEPRMDCQVDHILNVLNECT